MSEDERQSVRPSLTKWYELFSRGARDWLRHDEKVREAVREHLPRDRRRRRRHQRRAARPCACRCGCSSTTTSVCARPQESQGAGQGAAKPGDGSPAPDRASGAGEKAAGGDDEGEHPAAARVQGRRHRRLALGRDAAAQSESASAGAADDGLDARRLGPPRRALAPRPAPLAARRSVKRRDRPSAHARRFTDDDLRFRQLARREQPADACRGVLHARRVGQHGATGTASSPRRFFFWVVQGLRRQYRHARDRVRRAHDGGLGVRGGRVLPGDGTGGTFMSTGAHARCARSSMSATARRSYNIYLFYASDGENSPSDNAPATRALAWSCCGDAALLPASSRSARAVDGSPPATPAGCSCSLPPTAIRSAAATR